MTDDYKWVCPYCSNTNTVVPINDNNSYYIICEKCDMSSNVKSVINVDKCKICNNDCKLCIYE